jgi:hypothetical protein
MEAFAGLEGKSRYDATRVREGRRVFDMIVLNHLIIQRITHGIDLAAAAAPPISGHGIFPFGLAADLGRKLLKRTSWTKAKLRQPAPAPSRKGGSAKISLCYHHSGSA